MGRASSQKRAWHVTSEPDSGEKDNHVGFDPAWGIRSQTGYKGSPQMRRSHGRDRKLVTYKGVDQTM